MSIMITTCICGRSHEVDIDTESTRCPRCGRFYYLDEDYLDEPRMEPDYGGAFDGHTVTSDSDPGL